MIIRKLNQIQKEKLSAGKNTFRQILISSNEAPNFALRKFIIEPGGSMPMHTNLVEHVQYILKGSAEIIIDSKIFTVAKDNIVFIPANIPHSYKTIGDEPFEFLCIVPNKEDKITIV